MPQIVYVLTNAEMPGLVKIGITNGDVAERVKQLDNTSIPVPFECFYAAEVVDAARVERAIHEAFDDHRVRQSREFFRLSLNDGSHSARKDKQMADRPFKIPKLTRTILGLMSRLEETLAYPSSILISKVLKNNFV